tara:strand:+ start:546 stop:716 length:171 start_codon:yes stop_codon:yes gene_type:complete
MSEQMYKNAVNKECLQDLAKLVTQYQKQKIDPCEFANAVCDRIYELDDPEDIINDR